MGKTKLVKRIYKPTKTQLHNLEEFLAVANEDGVLMASKWVSGSGRYTSNRALPPFCEEFDARKAAKVSRRAATYLVKYPQVKTIIMVDWNAVEMWKADEFTHDEVMLG